ncbi:MAG: hypothetical protein QM594_02865 [Niabella sp.]
MKKNYLLMIAFSVSVTTASVAQVATTPELPRNYKPQAKELLPMPGELTDEMIFPALGRYEYADSEGEVLQVTVTRDSENKGVIWINGMPQGKFKADLKASPATYKIPVQKTLQNEVVEEEATEEQEAATEEAVGTGTAHSKARYSGKSLNEGTVIFDSASNKLYVNIGGRFNEEDPAAVFPEIAEIDVDDMEVAAETTDSSEEVIATAKNADKKDKKNKVADKGTNYILAKVVDLAAAPAVKR